MWPLPHSSRFAGYQTLGLRGCGSLCRAGRLVLMQGGQLGDVHRLTEPKVRQLHVAIAAQQQVVRLDVPADKRSTLKSLLTNDPSEVPGCCLTPSRHCSSLMNKNPFYMPLTRQLDSRADICPTDTGDKEDGAMLACGCNCSCAGPQWPVLSLPCRSVSPHMTRCPSSSGVSAHNTPQNGYPLI